MNKRGVSGIIVSIVVLIAIVLIMILWTATGPIIKKVLRIGNNSFQEEISAALSGPCADGTSAGTCSIQKPLFCDNGMLIQDCQMCGCGSDSTCNVGTGKCEVETIEPLPTPEHGNICYQESANIVNQGGKDGNCGLNYGGSYSWSFASNPLNAFDGNWTTSATGNSASYIMVNYTKPNNPSLTGAVWQYKGGSSFYFNTTIDSTCFSQNPIRLKMNASGTNVISSCYNGSTFITIRTVSAKIILFEEGIYWNISSAEPIEPPANSINSCRIINESGNYILTKNVLNNSGVSGLRGCIEIQSDNVYLDCKGYSLEYNGYAGIRSNKKNTTIVNCNIRMTNVVKGNVVSEGLGIMLENSENSKILGNNVYTMTAGVYLKSSKNSLVKNNTAYGRFKAFYLEFSNNNTLEDNYASGGYHGYAVYSSDYNKLMGNKASGCSSGLYATGQMINSYTVEGSDFNVYKDNIFNNNDFGIWNADSHNNNFINNSVNKNSQYGIYIIKSRNNNIIDNKVSENYQLGIVLTASSNNSVKSNTANSNFNVLSKTYSSAGLYLSSGSNFNFIFNNTMLNNKWGLYIYSSNNNNITGNTAQNSSYNNSGWDLNCVSSTGNYGLKNKFDKFVECDDGWPLNEIPDSGNTKNMSLYSPKETFLISDKNWKDVLPFVSVAVWTENEAIKKYPFLIYHSEEGVGFPEYNPTSFLEQAEYKPAYSVNGKSLVRFYLDDSSKKEFLKQDLDIAEVGKDYADVVLTSKQKEYFEDVGYDLETKYVNSYNPFRDYNGYSDGQYHSYESMKEELEILSQSYSDIAHLYEIGKSIENRSILAMKISDNPETVEQEEKILVVGDTHAREIMTVEVPVYMIKFLLERYGSDSEIKNIVDNYELWFVPMVNPDGHVRVEQGDIWWRKNTRDNNNDGIIDDNDGVDLNRNYGFTWGYDDLGSSPSPSSDSYRGTGAFSEPETQAIRDLVINNNFTYAIDYHSYAGVILYPWGHILDASEDDSYFSSIANNMKKVLKSYTSGQISHVMYYSNGDSVDWEYGGIEKNKVISFGIELASNYGFNPPASEIMPRCQEQLMMLLNLTGYSFTTREKIDADSAIYFMQQYSLSRLTIIGNTSQQIDNLLIATPKVGAGLQSSQIQRINPEDYLSYWKSYDKVVYVEDDYELALLASTYASLINAPLVIQGTENDADFIFNGKRLICVGSVYPSQGCNENYTLEQLQQRYYNLTGTKKLIIVNPTDINSAASDSLQPKKTSDEINEVYGKTSLNAPILASAKHELIISSNTSNAQSIDSYIENVFETNYKEEINSCSYGESCASGFSNNPVDMPGVSDRLHVSFKGQADVFIQDIDVLPFQLNQEGNFDITIKNNGFDEASDVAVSVYEINQSGSGGGGGGGPYSSYSGEFILIGSASLGTLDVDDAKQAVISYTPHSVGMKVIWVNVSTSSNESNTDNNEQMTSVNVVGPSPDISVVPNIPDFLRLNSDNEIIVNVSNIGSLDSESVDVSLYRRTWDSTGEQKILIGTKNIPSLVAGNKEMVDFSFSPQEEGYYDFYVEAITENDANMNNNDFYFSVMAGMGEPRMYMYSNILQLILVNENTNINITLWNDGFETAKNAQIEFYIQYNGQDRLLVEKKGVGDLAGRNSKTTSFNYVFNNVGYVYIIFNVSYEYQGIKSSESWYWTNVKVP